MLNDWYNNQPDGNIEWEKEEAEITLKERLFSSIQGTLSGAEKHAPVKIKRKNRWYAVAACAIITAAVSYFSVKKPDAREISRPVVASAGNISEYTRYLKLPDGSTVVLHANSTLDYPTSFTGNSREVTLAGEAYFDIAHNESKPFIIHTGKIKTTVLGTAFNIAAYSDHKTIVVSVTRGKVKVEDDKKVLAVLTPDQQITYSIPSAVAEQQTIDVKHAAIHWVKEDMSFDGISFAAIAEILSKRYNVNISFKNPALEKCTIKAFFKGTESLDKVLEALAVISDAGYVHTDEKHIVIDGEGCM